MAVSDRGRRAFLGGVTLGLVGVCAGCGAGASVGRKTDASAVEAGAADASGGDGSTADTSAADTSTADTSAADTSTADTSTADTSAADTSAVEAGLPDAAALDGPATDAASAADAASSTTGDFCRLAGTYSFMVHGVGFDTWNGMEVRVAAVEPTQSTAPVVARMTETIVAGTFATACPMSISSNNDYPSVGLFVDLDGDGRCSPSDVGAELLYFAWQGDLDRTVDLQMGGLPVIGSRAGGTSSTPFCAYYGF